MSRIDKIIAKAINTVMENQQTDIKNWYKDDFPCDIWYDENHLANLDEDDLDIVQSDWVAENINYFVMKVCKELGIETDCIHKKDCHTALVEIIYEETKDRLLEKVKGATYEIIALQSIDFEQVKEDIQQACDRLNNCKTLQDISDYAQHDNNLGEICLISTSHDDFEDIEEAIEEDVNLKDIDFIRFETLGKIYFPTFYFKNRKTNIYDVDFDIDNICFDLSSAKALIEDMQLSDFLDTEIKKEDLEM